MVNFIIIIAILIAIFVVTKVMEIRHKFFVGAVLVLLLLFYLSFSFVTKNSGAELSSAEGIMNAVGVYFDWLGTLFGNVKTITASAVNLEWSANSTAGKK